MPKPPVGRPFKKGQSGNPGGRTSAAWLRKWLDESVRDGDLSRRETYMQALFLTAIDRKHRNHVDACEIIAAYDMGKPVASVEHSGPGGDPIPLNLDWMGLDGVKKLREQVHAAAGGATEAKGQT